MTKQAPDWWRKQEKEQALLLEEAIVLAKALRLLPPEIERELDEAMGATEGETATERISLDQRFSLADVFEYASRMVRAVWPDTSAREVERIRLSVLESLPRLRK